MMNKLKSAEEYLKPYHLSYRDPSDRDSYSSYREGYSDAMDIASQIIVQAQKDAYNQALEDAVETASCEYEKDYLTGEIDKESILKLKK